jgi:hypothetical protein
MAVAALAALGSLPAAEATAGDCCQCGGCTRKVCKLVCEEKEIKDTCYGCECDAVCLPGCSKRGCLHRECVCGTEGCCGDCCGDSCDQAPHCVLEWFDWCPSRCAHLRHVNKLVKYEVSKKVCAYKWVVEEVCDNCCGNGCGNGCCDSGCCDNDCCNHGCCDGGAVEHDAAPVPADMGAPTDVPPVPPAPAPQAFREGRHTRTSQVRFRN